VARQGAWGSGQFAAGGDAQAGEQVLRRQTADATAARLTADAAAPGAPTRRTCPTTRYACRVLLVARARAARRQRQGDVGLRRAGRGATATRPPRW
jgi:hypothetical protein